MTASVLITMMQERIRVGGPQMPVYVELEVDGQPVLVPFEVGTGITTGAGKSVVCLKLTPAPVTQPVAR